MGGGKIVYGYMVMDTGTNMLAAVKQVGTITKLYPLCFKAECKLACDAWIKGMMNSAKKCGG